MIKQFTSEVYGEIIYEENIWTGKKTVKVNGTVLKTMAKNTYILNHGEEKINVYIHGNTFKGAILKIKEEKYEISSKTTTLEYILAFLPLVFILVWGSNPQLCAIFPVLGGAIGGAIGGVFAALSLSVMKSSQENSKKVLYGLLMMVAALGVCAGLGFILAGALS